MNKYCVYRHITPSNKCYIGITSQKPEDRWDSGYGYKNQIVFYRAIKKYGWNNIKHTILETNLTFEQACEREKYYISKYKSNDNKYGYNCTDGGEGVNGYVVTEQTKQKLREHNTGRHLSESTKLKLSISHTGKSLSEEHKLAISKKLKGKVSNRKGAKLSDETKLKISIANRGRKAHTQKHTEETKKKISEHCKGKIVSQETREKLRQRAYLQWKRQKKEKEKKV